jgi:hypothetical protein
MSRMCAPRFPEAKGRSVWLTDHFPRTRRRHVLPGKGRFCLAFRSDDSN